MRKQLLGLLCFTLACRASPESDSRVQVRVVFDVADAAAAILRTRLNGGQPDSAAWQTLFASEGYQRLKLREAAMNRAFTDSSFAAFLMSDTLLARAGVLLEALDQWHGAALLVSAQGVLGYLPEGTVIRANLYPQIKPKTNSFVHVADSVPGIFLYIDPAQPREKVENTTAHELHHIGLAAACGGRSDSSLTPPVAMLRRFLSGFGEGMAMLAAARGPDAHPHALSENEERAQWDSSMTQLPQSFAALERYFADVLEGRIASPDSVAQAGFAFFGVQGPWYTVGYHMASTIERERGRPALIAVMCQPRELMTLYNRVVASGPRWSDSLLRRLP